MTKHRILLEFTADTMPDDFLDQIAGRVYGHPAVDKKECTAAFVGDVLKDAERYRYMRNDATFKSRNGPGLYWYLPRFLQGNAAEQLDAAIDAAKDTK